MNKEQLTIFFKGLSDTATLTGSKFVDYIAYFLIQHNKQDYFTVAQITDCFDLLNLKSYARTAAYLSENAHSKKGKYIKHKVGYRLEHRTLEAIKKEVSAAPKKIEVSQHLANLIQNINDPHEQKFLLEAVDCYTVGAGRAFMIMVWILTMSHIQKFTFDHKINEFNAALTISPDKKIKKIVNFDDFSDLSESKFIELLRSSGIISNDVRKILEEKLGIRNSAAHPSAINFSPNKVAEFALDLIENVLLKY